MDTTVDIVLPVFALVAVGYAIGRTRLLGDGGVQGISNFVFYVAIPTLLFRTMSRIELPEIGSLGIVFAYFGGCLLVFPVAAVVGRLLFDIGRDEQAVMGMGAVFSNTVLLGIPLVFTAFGEDAERARELAYEGASKISFAGMQMRTDIGRVAVPIK